MCNPIGAMMGVEVAGGILGAAGSISQGNAARRYYDHLADQNNREATLTQVRADEAVTGVMKQAADVEQQRSDAVKKLTGVQKTTQAAQGILSGLSKTAEDVAVDTLTQSEKDAAALRYNADIKAQEIKTGAADRAGALRGQADAYRGAGSNALRVGGLNAASTLLTSAGMVSDTWLRWNQTSRGKKAGNG